jgi:hypothetical protein
LIVVECNNDECFIRAIGFSRKSVKHERGKEGVLERVKEGMIGIIDEDPDSTQSHERKKYFEKESKSTIKLLVNKDDENKRIIQLTPMLELWLLYRARQNGISPKDYNLPDDPHELKKIPRLDNRKDFLNFIKKLIEIDDEIDTLKKWLNGY